MIETKSECPRDNCSGCDSCFTVIGDAVFEAVKNLDNALISERAAHEATKRELDQLQVQLAGCGVAARGGTNEENVAEKGDFGWSPAYQDTLDLRLKYEATKRELEAYKANAYLHDIERDQLRADVERLKQEQEALTSERNEWVGLSNRRRDEVEHLKRHQFSASMAAAMLDLRDELKTDATLSGHEVVRKAIAEVERLKACVEVVCAAVRSQPAPKRYVVKIGAQTWGYGTKEGSEKKAAVARDLGIAAAVEEVDGE